MWNAVTSLPTEAWRPCCRPLSWILFFNVRAKRYTERFNERARGRSLGLLAISGRASLTSAEIIPFDRVLVAAFWAFEHFRMP
jgi:hypothetical protein